MRYYSRCGVADQEKRRKSLDASRRVDKQQAFLVNEAVRTVFERPDVPFELPRVRRLFGVFKVPVLSKDTFVAGFSRGYEPWFDLNASADAIRQRGRTKITARLGEISMVREQRKLPPKIVAVSLSCDSLRLEQQAARDTLFAGGARGFKNRRGVPLDPTALQLVETHDRVPVGPRIEAIRTNHDDQEVPIALLEDLDGLLQESFDTFGVRHIELLPVVVEVRKRGD